MKFLLFLILLLLLCLIWFNFQWIFVYFGGFFFLSFNKVLVLGWVFLVVVEVVLDYVNKFDILYGYELYMIVKDLKVLCLVQYNFIDSFFFVCDI